MASYTASSFLFTIDNKTDLWIEVEGFMKTRLRLILWTWMSVSFSEQWLMFLVTLRQTPLLRLFFSRVSQYIHVNFNNYEKYM